MFDFKTALQKATSLSFLTEGREKGEITDIVNMPITLMGYDFADSRDMDTNEVIVDEKTGEIQKYAIFIIKEDNDHYFNAGTVISNALFRVHQGTGMSTEDATEELTQSGGVPFTITKKKSRGNNTYWAMVVR